MKGSEEKDRDHILIVCPAVSNAGIAMPYGGWESWSWTDFLQDTSLHDQSSRCYLALHYNTTDEHKMTLQQTTPSSSSSLHLFSSTLPQKRPRHNLAFTSLIQHKPLLSSPHHHFHLSRIKCDFDELNIIHGQKLLSNLCTWGIGGPCAHFAQVSNHNQLISTIRFCRETSIGFVIVGKGSNCLFDDMGFDGCVILNGIDFVENTDDELLGGCYYRVGSGCPFNRFGIQSCIDGFGGLEFAAGIPGTVGGAVYMNAGADGQETSDTVNSVEIVTIDGERRVFDRNDLAFGYRWSCFQEMEDLAAIPVGERSAGSVFRNPSGVGISAGELIEKAGMKGFTVGGAKEEVVAAGGGTECWIDRCLGILRVEG
ncbi:hypothetical protein Sjap_024494 [Stephania japonica]|uniref:UDP-N-acetylmuramate dehydrogenase n=1 Tax=Stephania japonica TaxID=461633 RepID=A0AAP0HNS2_9MAGN